MQLACGPRRRVWANAQMRGRRRTDAQLPRRGRVPLAAERTWSGAPVGCTVRTTEDCWYAIDPCAADVCDEAQLCPHRSTHDSNFLNKVAILSRTGGLTIPHISIALCREM